MLVLVIGGGGGRQRQRDRKVELEITKCRVLRMMSKALSLIEYGFGDGGCDASAISRHC